MTHTPSQNDIVNDYLATLDPAIAPLFHAVRAVVLAAGPTLHESIKWKNCLVYATTRNHIQTVVGKGKVSLIFLEGSAMEDVYGLLEGDGKKARTMRITSPDFNQTALRNYVKQSLKTGK